MKMTLLASLSLLVIVGFGACERHSWESTKRLYPAPSESKADAGAGNQDAPEADGERDASVLP